MLFIHLYNPTIFCLPKYNLIIFFRDIIEDKVIEIIFLHFSVNLISILSRKRSLNNVIYDYSDRKNMIVHIRLNYMSYIVLKSHKGKYIKKSA